MKPGLVCPESPGSHDDMDYHLYIASAEALRDCFTRCAAAGYGFSGDDPRALLPELRPIGIEGERRMYGATGGVNTHKGAIFCLGILAAQAGRHAAMRERSDIDRSRRSSDAILDGVREMCRGLVAAELAGSDTAGRRLFRDAGLPGARGQAEAGYPIVRERMLPLLRARNQGVEPAGAPHDAALLDALLASIAALDDSCLHSRGGIGALEFAREGASRVLSLGGSGSAAGSAELVMYAAEMKRRRLSPGGSADMLACAIFLDSIDRGAGYIAPPPASGRSS